MWSSCHPKSDEDMKECAELGKSLNRLSQPTILTLLACSDKPLHGYVIVQQASESPMFGGKKPDATGIYRALKRMSSSPPYGTRRRRARPSACSRSPTRAAAACAAGSTPWPATSSPSKSSAASPPAPWASTSPTLPCARISNAPPLLH